MLFPFAIYSIFIVVFKKRSLFYSLIYIAGSRDLLRNPSLSMFSLVVQGWRFNPFSIITSAHMLIIWMLSPFSSVYTGEQRRLFCREIPVEGAFCDQIFAYLP